MRFSLSVFAASCSLALRPDAQLASVSKRIAAIGDLASQMTNPKDSLVALKKIGSQVSALIEANGPIDTHTDADDRSVLESVIPLIQNTVYDSMTASHNSDIADLNAAINAADSCNQDIASRQSPEGDLGSLLSETQVKQGALDKLGDDVDAATVENETKWGEFDTHMQMISEPPPCSELPARTMQALDVFFETSAYANWFAVQQPAYHTQRDAFTAANIALENAILQYNLKKAERDTQFCDYKTELEAACAAFDTCFSEKSDFFTDTLVPRVTGDMNTRKKVKESGDIVIHQIKFLLGTVGEQAAPAADTTAYQITFPELPAKGLCDLSTLADASWEPPPEC